jgi:rfaE bifunctional protein kinase chain/domain
MGMMVHSIADVLSQARLEELLGKVKDVRVGVVGDMALDAYWQVDMRRARLSRETPHFAKPVVGERYAPGAGGNAAVNLAKLGMRSVSAFSVVGEDAWGPILRDALEKAGVRTEALLSDPSRRTPAYVKPILMGYESQQEDARLDFENTTGLAGFLEERLVQSLEERLPELDALLVADQFEEFGLVTEGVRSALIRLAEQYPQKVFVVDSRQNIGLFRNLALKPNGMEALRALGEQAGVEGATVERLAEVGAELSRRCGRPVYLTLGEGGVLVCMTEAQERVKAAPVRPPLDFVGAGDMFIAALAGMLAAGATPQEAGAVANLAAAVTVEKLNQTGSASPEEILARYRMYPSAIAR